MNQSGNECASEPQFTHSPTVLIERIQPPYDAAELFLRLVHEPYPFYLDSVLPDAELGRYSLLGACPFLIFRSRGDQIERIWSHRTERFRADPWVALRQTLQRFDTTELTEFPFAGGAVGYFAYDLGRSIEDLPQHAHDDLQLPECWLAFYGACYVFDHRTHDLVLIATNHDAPGNTRVASQRLDWLKRTIQARPHKVSAHAGPGGMDASSLPRSNFSQDAYLKAVERIQDYIASGDIYQANLSQRFHAQWQADICDLYLRLRETNPAPFATYLDTGECAVLSSSPERFLKFDAHSRTIETCPIKGTRPRGKTPSEDAALADSLFRSVKDRAELLMIVDLERNDLGRVSESGSVAVPSLFRLESYATVHHLVSTVTGRLAPEYDRVDLLRATFPGGSITGAPKIRAMEIIEELEPTRRHIYTGSLGYLSFTGDMDLNIAIRTLLLKGQDVYFQLGGGIVADSEPQLEYEETLHKGQALFEALRGSPGLT